MSTVDMFVQNEAEKYASSKAEMKVLHQKLVYTVDEFETK